MTFLVAARGVLPNNYSYMSSRPAEKYVLGRDTVLRRYDEYKTHILEVIMSLSLYEGRNVVLYAHYRHSLVFLVWLEGCAELL
jgi:hypothetical protein